MLPSANAPAASVGPSVPSVARNAIRISSQLAKESAAASAISWFRPPLPSPCKVTVVSPPRTRQAGCERARSVACIVSPRTRPLARPAITLATSQASPSRNVDSKMVSKPSCCASLAAAWAASRLLPTMTFCTPSKIGSLAFGVSGMAPFIPALRWLVIEAGISSTTLWRSNIDHASPNIVGSATVGPEAITSSGSPTTSERIRLMTGDGDASCANCPPLSCEMCFRMVLISLMVAPQLSRTWVRACRSASEMPATGDVNRAEPPPEMRHSTRSRLVVLRSRSAICPAPCRPASSGTG